MTVPVSYAVEGIVDQAVVLKLFKASGIVSGTAYVCDGIDNLRQRLTGFNAGARYSPWFVLSSSTDICVQTMLLLFCYRASFAR